MEGVNILLFIVVTLVAIILLLNTIAFLKSAIVPTEIDISAKGASERLNLTTDEVVHDLVDILGERKHTDIKAGSKATLLVNSYSAFPEIIPTLGISERELRLDDLTYTYIPKTQESKPYWERRKICPVQ